ncbi:TetR/AcrR family transcriptional regulator C-terminal domain-containing protein [Paenibacillus sacheonensis]|uniref:TetR family transcriptional regulator n=1 Tax=Paenibacillus sacheonensis TaxID=742054 RepID=A0A7X4YTP6_9BACL|nr:TetR/AcrR family transcriptional regulator C-terminal domain-containing protein [Paenibacillus sacheonensis]MBM7567519.1 AcrR family transcriptional regulator [Paenibacillus sacheonensis]NBC71376.1 TetR family transcriptional regulator [Paenibacillus sacheonensis]
MARKRTVPPLALIGFEENEDLHTPLSRARIIQSAIRQLNEHGLKDLSMRKVADDLGVQPASLYYHVKGKEQLLQLLTDKISSEMARPDPSLPWRTQLLQWAEQFRAVLGTCRDASELFNATIGLGYNRLTQIENLYGMLADAGFEDKLIPWIASILKSYVLGFAAEEARFASFAGDSAVTSEELSQEYARIYDGLPAEKFPNLIRLAPFTTSTDWQQEFDFGLGVLLDGLAAKL